jgi:hypothetical protein
VRRIFGLIVLGLPGLALAQDLATARIMMDGALTELSGHSRLTLALNGTEKDGNRTKTFSAVLAVAFTIQNGQQKVHCELLDYRDNQLTNRSAGDGERFWDYDVRGKAYTSTEYGTARFVGAERERLFQNMMLRFEGEQTFLAKLLRDTYGGKLKASTAWLPWRPSANVSVQGESIVCSATIPSPNRLTYYLQKENGFGWALNSADYHEEAVISGRTRVTQWTVSIYRDYLPQGTSWLFVPPAGSRALAVNEAGG